MSESGGSTEILGNKGVWLVLAAAILWGTTGTVQALAPAGSSPQAIGALRLALGGSALALSAWLRGGLRLRSWPPLLTVAAGAFVALYQVTFFSAVLKTGVAVGTIVGIGSAPVFAGILEYLVRQRRPGRRWYFSTAVAVFGCLLLVLQSGDIRIDIGGVVLALAAGFSYAAYALAIKLLLPGRSPEDVTAVIFCLGAIFLSPLLVTADLTWLGQVNGWLLMLHLGLVATALSYWFFASGLKTVAASTAVTLSLAEPLTAAILGIVVVGERINVVSSLGLVLILSALVLLIVPDRVEGRRR
ncbi:EamA family transporter [Desulfoprunum benzoelyticum]|uniref:DME family drug/metabolite transporter n=1 Tax=Desulfoprunum benzoelyticum TaxID=1506996 RepID=A0A840ULT5_9BACT|nr:DMT family transporter [Desulfoprunum benzoelyticum]MBB5346565.1 DME family drug/metabolite transporter [Desulfoprunum benzoelyticum]MBM9528906.1 EamA family transporter [Desulfoprunum benzoelyticum]